MHRHITVTAMQRFLIQTSFLALLSLGSLTPAWSQVYQWKDASGRTIISDTPPPANAKVKRTNADQTGSGSAAASGKSLAEQEIEFRKRQLEQQDRATQEAREKELQENRRRACADVRRQLGSLQSGERISLRDDKGERYFMDDAQRAEEIRRAQSFLDGNCKGM